MYNFIKRIFDICLALVLGIFLIIPIFIIAIVVKLTSKGPALYWSDRVGIRNSIFKMPKFRTMQIDTPALATHLLKDGKNYLTPVGSFLRKTSMDEFPQLWNILIGEMSFVGPRPALFNQYDLIEMRTSKGIHKLKPGLTGYAQIMGRDEIPLHKKVEFDYEYLQKKSFLFDIEIMIKTFFKVLKSDDISH